MTFASELDAPRELTGYAASTYGAARVDRDTALAVPAVKRARDIICGTLGRLPVRLHGSDRRVVDWPLLAQPEDGRAPSVTWTETYEDLLFEQVAFWVVTSRDRLGWPRRVVRVDARSANVQKRLVVLRDGAGQVVGQREIWEDRPDVIRFESPGPALLVHGARAIRTLLRLEAAASMYADTPPAHEFFTPAEGADPAEDDEIREFLADWQDARNTRSTAYVPYALKHQQAQAMTPEQLQLADSRQKAILEISRLTGVDAEHLQVSTTSRTYKNNIEAKHELVDLTLADYSEAVEGRLNLDDVTPPGSYSLTDYSKFLRANELQRMQIYRLGREVGAYDDERIAAAEDIPSASIGGAA